MLKTMLIAAAALNITFGATAFGQDEEPATEPTEPAIPAPPWTVGENTRMQWELEDVPLREIITRFIGSFEAPESAVSPDSPIQFHGEAVNIDGLSNAVFFEVHRSDDPANSFQFGILHAYYYENTPRLRFFEFANPTLGPALSGMWLAPYAFPKLSMEDLRPVMDLEFTGDVGKTPHPYPTTDSGAVELTSRVAFTADGFQLADRFYDANGGLVWGMPEGESLEFTSTEPSATVTATEAGLIVIDIIDPDDAVAHEEGGEMAVHYTGYLMDGTVFDTSRQEGRDAFRVQIPGRLIQGWNEGMNGIEVGGRRRLIIPPALGYGERGAGRVIPANAALVFDVECMWVKNPEPVDEADPAQQPDEAPEETPEEG